MLATVCVEKDYNFFPVTKGHLFVSIDDRAELFLNGESILPFRDCWRFHKIPISSKYGDVIAVKATNLNVDAGLRLVFVVNNNHVFSTNSTGWKVIEEFLETEDNLAWTRPEYIDNAWPEAREGISRCKPTNFLSDIRPLWTNNSLYVETVFFRYRVTIWNENVELMFHL